MYDVVFLCVQYAVTWCSLNYMVFCSVLFSNMGCYIIVEYIQSVF